LKKRNNLGSFGRSLVQHAVVAMFESFHQGKISIEKIVEKCAIIRQDFKIENVVLLKKAIMLI
jgi:dihydroorotase